MKKGLCLIFNLGVELVVGQAVDVVEFVVVRDRDVLATRDDLNHLPFIHSIPYLKRQPEVLDVSLIIFNKLDVRVDLLVKRLQLVQVVILALHPAQEEPSKFRLKQDAFVERAAHHGSDKIEVLEMGGAEGEKRVRVRVYRLFSGQPEEAAFWVKDLFAKLSKKLLEEPSIIDPSLEIPPLVNEDDHQSRPQIGL